MKVLDVNGHFILYHNNHIYSDSQDNKQTLYFTPMFYFWPCWCTVGIIGYVYKKKTKTPKG